MLSLMSLDTQTAAGMTRGIEMLIQVEATTKTSGSWETAFLEVFKTQFSSMQNFYEQFEAAKGASGTYTYVAPIPTSACETGSCSTSRAASTEFTLAGAIFAMAGIMAVCHTM